MKFRMDAEEAFEKKKRKKKPQVSFAGYKDGKTLGSTSIGNFALDYITPCTIDHVTNGSLCNDFFLV